MTRTGPWRKLRTGRGLRNLALTGTAASASAGLGGIATNPDSAWYSTIEKPSWQPPPIAFPLVWTPLYADIAVVTAAAITALEGQGRNDEVADLRRALMVNLALNTGWSVLFFRVRRPWLSTLWAGLLASNSASLARRCSRVDPSLGLALAPYPAWCTFATALNASIARRNS